ncbi:MAG: hypothetical protein ACREM9_10295 [Gemmatimonadales bacterium]
MTPGIRWPLLATVALAGCDSVTETGSDGRIQIEVVTSGANPQSEQYLLTLDGTRPLSVAANGSTIYDSVPEGTHVVHLFSLADNCAVSGGSSPRSVQVRGGDVSEITFTVVCGPPITGGFRVVVSSAGTLTDEDGYQLSVAGAPLRGISVNAEETYEGLTPGLHLITLKDVADFCEVEGGNPQPYTVVAGKTVRVGIQVACGGVPGPLE